MPDADPLRFPTFTDFGGADFLFEDQVHAPWQPDPGCGGQDAGFTWSHGVGQGGIAGALAGLRLGRSMQSLGVDAGL